MEQEKEPTITEGTMSGEEESPPATTTAIISTVNDAACSDDDDDSSSSSSEDDDENNNTNDEWHSLTLMERRARKIARNEAKLNALGLGHYLNNNKHKRSPQKQPSAASPDGENGDHGSLPQGMLLNFAKEDQVNENVQKPDDALWSLLERFPGRETEIRSLYAQLDFGMRQAATLVPAPLWITGTPGTGKSVVTHAVLQSLQHQVSTTTQLPPPIVCHVCPQALPPPLSVEALVSFIYTSVWNQLGFADSTVFVERKKKKRGRKNDAADVPARSLRQRAATVHYTDNPQASNNGNHNHHRAKSKTSRLTAQDMAESIVPKLSKAYTAIYTLGRFLQSLGRATVLVLDQIYVLHDFNILAQFLLLPRQLEMNLTVIVITNNVLLDQTRLNMMTSNSTSSLASCIQPCRIHFPAYRGRGTFETILLLPRIRTMIVGTDENTKSTGDGSFQTKVYHSFVRTLMQSTYDLTKNVKEMIRFGRILWVRYTDSLHPSKIDGTLQAISRKLASFQPPVEATAGRVEEELLAFLDRKVLTQVRTLIEEYLFAVSVRIDQNDVQHGMPDRAKYLLLAAYLCQVNRPDRDKHLFSIQKNGRRRKSATESNTMSEDTAFGANAMAQPKSLRLRTFPLERMLSIFVSVVTLHQMANNKESLPEKDTEQLLLLGDASLQQNLEYLQDVGLLHEQPVTGPADPVRLTGRRYWCELTEAEALQLAESLEFPLTRYIL